MQIGKPFKMYYLYYLIIWRVSVVVLPIKAVNKETQVYMFTW